MFECMYNNGVCLNMYDCCRCDYFLDLKLSECLELVKEE